MSLHCASVLELRSYFQIYRSDYLQCTVVYLGAEGVVSDMDGLLLLIIVCSVVLALFVVYLILSSCMGDRFRARISGAGMDINSGSYEKAYARNFASALQHGGWEQIEMQDMLDQNDHHDTPDEPRLRLS